jgi:hypothetical protein
VALLHRPWRRVIDVAAALHEARAPSCLHTLPSPRSSHGRTPGSSLPLARSISARPPSRNLAGSPPVVVSHCHGVRRRRSCWLLGPSLAYHCCSKEIGDGMNSRARPWPLLIKTRDDGGSPPRPQPCGKPAFIHVSSSSSTAAAPRHVTARLMCFDRFINVSFVPDKQYC